MSVRVSKSVKISTDQFFTQKISTKTAWFTTFPNSRQNSVNGQILASTGATTTVASSTAGAIANVLQAPILETQFTVLLAQSAME